MFRFPSPNRNRGILFYSFEHLKKRIRLIVFPLFCCVVLSYRYECMLFFVHMGNFSPVDRDEKTKIVEQKLASFGTVVRLCRLLLLPLRWKNIQDKYYVISASMLR